MIKEYREIEVNFAASVTSGKVLMCSEKKSTLAATATTIVLGCSSLTSRSGFRVVLRRGNASNGANAGLAYLNSNNAFSNSNANYSSPLNTLKINRMMRTLSLDRKTSIADVIPVEKSKVYDQSNCRYTIAP